MEESQELALTQLRKSVEKLSSSTEGYEKPTLMRFLIARSMNPDKAAKMFVDWQKWRASMIPPSGFIPDSDRKFLVHVLDKSIASAIQGKEVGDEKVACLIDLQNITYKNLDARGTITGFQILQAYYPERLSKCYILHMPGFFVTLWGFVCRFLDKATKEKIVIVTDSEEQRKLEEEVGLDALPEEYGGRAKLTAFQDVLPPLAAPRMLTTNNNA
ncbi:hypothetical protein F2Q68_00042338 [Brassica cretica]|uniref:CRAL-TRIO domain-containing protein n=1 Tax=Brassica cretica TaxID=69181 RepID=A0A8S9MDR9_BRACR|nr:hypothetical protein F2Q68_00042338 [Brassica cretica]